MKWISILQFSLLWFCFSAAQAQTLQILSYNIHHGTNKEEVNTLDEIAAFIKTSKADLVGLQEVDSVCTRSGKIDQMKRLAELTGMHYVFVRHFAYQGGAYGLGILSRFPIQDIKNDRIITLLKKNEAGKQSLALLWAKIKVSDDNEIVFSTVHFGLDQASRMLQAKEVLNYLKSSLPVVLTGDLNAGPEAKEINLLRGYFLDTDLSAAFTFPFDKPVKKIDYIFVNNSRLRKVKETKVWNTVYSSDHLPFSSKVMLR